MSARDDAKYGPSVNEFAPDGWCDPHNCDNCRDTGFDEYGNECNKCDYLEDDNENA